MKRLRSSLRFARSRSAQAGLAVIGLIVLVAILGPYVAGESPTATVGVPGSGSSGAALLGTDTLGRPVLSRVLHGGRSILLLSVSATVIAYALGLAIGLVSGYTRSTLDAVLMRVVDVLLAFPSLLVLLLAIVAFGTSEVVLVLAVALLLMPRVARVVRTATLEVSVRGYVEAAVARGERLGGVLFHEILPNIAGVVLADVGLRYTYSIGLIASVNFLGLGIQPPSSDWALMISENRDLSSLNPWSILVPAALIALLTIGVNLVGDAIAATLGRSPARPENPA